ncbi:MAG: TolC family protein [Sneathiella sp.]
MLGRFGVTKRHFLASSAVVFGIISVAVFPAILSADTLEEELQYLLETHPQLDVGKQNVEVAIQGTDAAFSGFLPKVSLNGDAGWEKTENKSLTASDGSPYDTDRYRAGIEVRQNLYQGSRTTSELAAAEKNKVIADKDLSFVQQQLLFEGTTAYLNVERYGFLKLLAYENEKTLKKQLQLEDERVQRGAGIEVDVLQAKSRLQRAKERRVGIVGGFNEALARYQQVFAKPANEDSMVAAVPPLDMIPESIEDSLKIAGDNNLQIIVGKLQAEVSEEGKVQAASSYQPSLDAVARYNWEENVDGTKGIERSIFTGLELNWEIFSGFLTDAQVGQASARHSAALASLRYTKVKVDEEVRIAWRILETAQERQELLDNAVNIAAEVFIARQQLRDGGKETALNVLDAENEFYTARIAHVGATYEARAAVYKLLLAIGELTPANLGL